MSAIDKAQFQPAKSSLLLSLMMIGFGLLAIALPVATSIRIAVLAGWLIVFAGFVQFVYAFRSKGIGHVLWKLGVAGIYLLAGAYLVLHPAMGIASFTLLLAIFFLAEGILDVVTYFFANKSGSSPWILLDGVVTIILSALIWMLWPSKSLRFVGLLVGASMTMTGTSRLMMALAARKREKNLVKGHASEVAA